MTQPLSTPRDSIRIVLFERIHDNALERFAAASYSNVETIGHTPDAAELAERIADAHIVGIRSRTHLTPDILAAARRLIGVGCFCIGTNQVAVGDAKGRGIPVFNAPYSNTRSVAELVLSEMILLYRRIPEKSKAAHAGGWLKTAAGAYEIRGKVLGIVGYGHIGSQLSVLAEALGIRVCYYDITEKLSLGNAISCRSLDELLRAADVVSLHVPGTPETAGMIGARELDLLKPGAIVINAARGEVVDLDALATRLRGGRVGGAAVDVFPDEPAGPDDTLETPLRGLDNVLLTPHVGGSTEEAQANIAIEVADKLIKYSDTGSTVGAVNFVEVSLPMQKESTRFLHIHRNVPGVLAGTNGVFSGRGLNIAGQYLRTDAEIGYVVTDIEGRLEAGMGIRRELQNIDGTIRTRFLY